MNKTFRGMAAVITGASSGIGEAIALHLAREGARLLLAGRSAERLDLVAERARDLSPRVETFVADLAEDGQVQALADRAVTAFGGVDVLVHSIGLFLGGPFESPVEVLDRHYHINARVPYLLTQKLLPSLIARQGQVVFINSSAGHHAAKSGWVAYSASKHALRAVADGLRDEVNKKGVRVLTVFPGRTATPMQEEVHRYEGKDYDPERFLQPRDVAATVLNALALPRTAEVTDLHIRPMRG
ncbi:MAG TPA: SDR family oxidoreductase [Thermoanaerobaculia bacterium]|nr:SDR family oxidoreductase [Thermoanaerobaculia bacterium]